MLKTALISGGIVAIIAIFLLVIQHNHYKKSEQSYQAKIERLKKQNELENKTDKSNKTSKTSQSTDSSVNEISDDMIDLLKKNLTTFTKTIQIYNDTSNDLYKIMQKTRHADRFDESERQSNQEEFERVRSEFLELYNRLLASVDVNNEQSKTLIEDIDIIKNTNLSLSHDESDNETVNKESSLVVSQEAIDAYVNSEKELIASSDND